MAKIWQFMYQYLAIVAQDVRKFLRVSGTRHTGTSDVCTKFWHGTVEQVDVFKEGKGCKRSNIKRCKKKRNKAENRANINFCLERDQDHGGNNTPGAASFGNWANQAANLDRIFHKLMLETRILGMYFSALLYALHLCVRYIMAEFLIRKTLPERNRSNITALPVVVSIINKSAAI